MNFEDEYLKHYQGAIWMDFAYMEGFMLQVLVAAGVPEAEARIISEVLIESDRRGIDSHGIGRLKPIYIDRIRDGILEPATRIEVLRERRTTAVLDGHNGFGHVIGQRAMELAIGKAQEHGMGMVAVRNSSHYGIAGYYAEMAAREGMIGITGTNARPSIAPTFGVENMLGTNPIAVGMPTDENFPFLLDGATSITQRGKIEVYERAGMPLPPGWVIDENGHTSTDAAQVLKDLTQGHAALTPLGGLGEDGGGHKGYGLATVVEILSAALQDGAYLKMLNGYDEQGRKIPYPLGHFFIAISIEEFIDLERFKAITGDILRQLRASRRAPGCDRIFTPGEKEHLAREIRRTRGCPVPRPLQKDMAILRDWYGLGHRFPWE